MKYSLYKTVAALGTLLCATQVASAQFVQYGTRSSWLGATEVKAADDYEGHDFNPNNQGFLRLSDPTMLNGITYSNPVEMFGVSSVYSHDAPYLVTNYFEWEFGGSLIIDFNQMLTSFSVDFGQLLGTTRATAALQSQAEEGLIEIGTGTDVPPTPITFTFDNGVSIDRSFVENNFSFLGLTFSEPFRTVTISADLFPVIDNLAVGVATTNPTPVPEPATYGLMGAATLLGFVLLRRRGLVGLKS